MIPVPTSLLALVAVIAGALLTVHFVIYPALTHVMRNVKKQ